MVATTAATAGIQYLIAKKQKLPNVDRGKVDDIRASVPGYGEFIPKIWGIARIAPIWVWESPAVDHPVTTPGHSGGKSPKPPTATTVDHVYLKSVAGIFHDGQLYGKHPVRRIWFDTDLVASFITENLSSVLYEAEFGTLTGGATVATQAECSGGKKVTGIGSGGKCEISVHTEAGDYELAVHYTSLTDLTYKVYIDTILLGDLVCPASGAATIVAIATYASPITLTAADHLIRFENSGAACPDLDGIDLAMALTIDPIDTRDFSSVVDVSRIPPANQDHGWAYFNHLPDPGDGGGAGGAVGTPASTFNLGKYGQPSIRIYRGTRTQLADSAIVAQEGADSASAYRGFGYIVIEGIQLQGGRMPNVTLEVDQGIHSVPAITQDIYSLVAITPTQLNLTALNGLTLGDTSIDAGTYAAPTWQNKTNTTSGAGGAITKTGGADGAYNAGASHNAALPAATNGAIRFTPTIGSFTMGWSTSASPTNTSHILFGIQCHHSDLASNNRLTLQAAISGNNGTIDIGAWAPGDQFQIEIRNGKFRAYQNGIELGGFTPPVASFPLYPAFIAYSSGAGVTATSVSLAGAIGEEPSSGAGGLLLSSRRSAGDLLSDLQTRFQFDMVEVDGVVKAVLRNTLTADITIPYTDMRAVTVEPGSLPELPAFDCQISDIDPFLLPARVDVNYLDPGMDYHNNTQSDYKLDEEPQQDNQSVSLAIIDSADNMKALAIVLRHKAIMEGRAFVWQTSWKYMHVHPGSVASLTLANATHMVRITQAKYQLPVGVIEFQGVRQAASLYSPTATGSISAGFEAPISPVPANTKAVIIDGPLLRAEDAGDGTQPVVYIAMCGRGAGAWPGSFFRQEFPRGSLNYSRLLTAATQQSQIGVTTGALATVTDPSVWDRTANALVISFYTETVLESVTEAEVLANPELNLLGVVKPSTGEVEYIQYVTASAGVPVAPYLSKYTISTLLRGRAGTDGNVGIHAAGDDVVVMDSTVKPRRMELADIGT